MNPIERIHGSYAYDRRARVLSGHLAALLPQNARILDVGCGDGRLASLILQHRPDTRITGIDTLVRSKTYVPVEGFEGRIIPFGDAEFDVVMFVDVLHHTEDPMILLREAVRTARRAIVIKDHTRNGLLAGPTLRFMDKIGNERHGVASPNNYWSEGNWIEAFKELNLEIGIWKKKLRIYPGLAEWVFGRSLHFVARLDLNRAEVNCQL